MTVLSLLGIFAFAFFCWLALEIVFRLTKGIKIITDMSESDIIKKLTDENKKLSDELKILKKAAE